MNARDAILARVRTALRDVPRDETPADVEVPRLTAPVVPDPVGLFAERVADYKATVVRCTPAELPDRLAEALDGVGRLLVPTDLPPDLHPAGPELVADTHLPVTALDALDGVLTTARLGIAETGTIVLDHGPGQGRRAATLVPDLHVCVVRTDQVVGGVSDAVAALDPHRPQTWISGPSATSDIELDRVEGVHGPRTLHVLLVG
ncbi:MAG: lactate utilization protein [Pseudonocardia sp.]|uniref:LutC/YkgG family protein n=1 Tax=Pseudonocardia sp. TaxID=60912 RepID=UPI00260A899C|nr:lactate utilization protein C [Pseudonocardia sp.]MCU1629973.1 lactate utilization protein [Pseudonocardia sp.]MDT7698931.1 L-lactate dehydrogenase complex protein LldG [Pseudonocardiales bacterium]